MLVILVPSFHGSSGTSRTVSHPYQRLTDAGFSHLVRLPVTDDSGVGAAGVLTSTHAADLWWQPGGDGGSCRAGGVSAACRAFLAA